MSLTNRSSYAEIIDALLLWNPPDLSARRDPVANATQAGLPMQAIFANKHLRGSLQLRMICPGPEITPGISSVFKKAVIDVKTSGIELPPRHVHDHLQPVPMGQPLTTAKYVSSAKEVGEYYEQTAHSFCTTAASVLLYPTMPGWYNLFHIFNLDHSNGNFVSDAFCFPSIDPDTNPAAIYETIWKDLGETTLATLRDVRDEFPNLATWMFLPFTETSEEYLRNMDELCGSFPFKVHPVKGAPSPASTQPATSSRPDGRSPAWILPELESNEKTESTQPKRSSRIAARKEPVASSTKQKNTNVVEIPNTNDYRSSFGASSEFANIIQQAWMKSVEHDSSVIVFNCGSLERIAIRHRASQTLYISDVIDVSHCDKPKYGRLHLSLYMAIMQDAQDRMLQIRSTKEAERKKREQEESRPKTRKKTRLEQEEKKPVADPTTSVSSADAVLQESVPRNILLLSFDLGILVSTTPAAFTRSAHGLLPPTDDSTSTTPLFQELRQRKKFKPTQYLSITITSHIGEGAVGIVYGGVLQCQTKADATPIQTNVVVKLVFGAEEKEKLRHEYTVYERLVAAGAKGVPLMFGLFQDFIEDGPLIMVLSDCGRDLWTLRSSSTKKDSVDLPEKEQQLFIDAIRSVHKAGVMHHDIRPENLLITEDGTKATIIDFDQATFDPSAHDKHMERNEVVDLVKGNYTFDAGGHYETPQSYIPSASPAPSRRTRKRKSSRSTSHSSSSSNLSAISETSTIQGPESSA